MRLACDPAYEEVDLSASAEELNRLADAVAQGEGLFTSSPGSGVLAGVEVKDTPGPGVLIHLDSEQQFLVISGDSVGRAVLADNLRGMASAGDGGHLHVEYPAHDYLVDGSLPLVVNSPHGGMPTR
ncbi:Imm32 family immunity protein [Embleya sp. AB8]|uniref:Imm32 family immunity protein n=1 Tax=Embleya sp. AB8 TaxID=3156304 RepID=UPI003C795805